MFCNVAKLENRRLKYAVISYVSKHFITAYVITTTHACVHLCRRDTDHT